MCSSFFCRKFEFFCWHTGWNVWPIIISDNRPIVYRYMFLEVLMNNYKSLKKQLKFCIKTMNDSSSLFVVDSNKDFTRKRKHLFGSTLFNVLLLESGSLKDEMFKLFGYKLDTPTASSFVQARVRFALMHSIHYSICSMNEHRKSSFTKAIAFSLLTVLFCLSAVPSKILKPLFIRLIIRISLSPPITWIQATIYWNVLMMILFFKEMP